MTNRAAMWLLISYAFGRYRGDAPDELVVRMLVCWALAELMFGFVRAVRKMR